MTWPLLLHAQDLVEIDARNGREGRAFAGRIDGEAGVVGGQIDLADEGVGRLGRGDPRKPDPGVKPGTVLQRLEGPLRASSGKGRREGRPSLDGLCGEKAPIGSTPSCSSALATWVGEPRSISPALVVSEIVAAPVGVEAHRQAVLRKHLAQRPEGRGRAFLLDEKGRMDRPGRVIQRNNEIKGGPGPRARRGASRPDAASSPANGRRSRLRRCAPCAAPSEQRPPIADAASARCSHEPKPWSFTRCSWKCLTVKPGSAGDKAAPLPPPGRPEPACPTPCRAGGPKARPRPPHTSRRVQRRNVRSLTPSNSAASS